MGKYVAKCARCKKGMTVNDLEGFRGWIFQYQPHQFEDGELCDDCVGGMEFVGGLGTPIDMRGFSFVDDHGKSYTYSKKDGKPRFDDTGKVNRNVMKGIFDY
ncbi:MAG: hypothetical protein MPK62_01885 [Alphaproteobacteria bacterium]|nr:hypothetical protein [Alphaproteobacteria bacterium]MDA8029884.1 hypothetical protein [Alphaproteobacteria bacterium]